MVDVQKKKWLEDVIRMSGLSCILILLCISVFSQTESLSAKKPGKIEWSSVEGGSGKYWYSQVIGQSEEGTFLLKSNLSLETKEMSSGFKNRKYALAFYNAKFEFLWEKKITLPEKAAEEEKFVFLNDQLQTIYSVVDKKNESYRILCQSVDMNGVAPAVSKTLLSLSGIRHSEALHPGFAVSNSQSLFAVLVPMIRVHQDSIDTVNESLICISVSDETMNPFFNKTIHLPVPAGKLSSENVFISNDSILFLSMLFTENKRSRLMICSYDIKTEKAQMTQIELGEKFITDAYYKVDDFNQKLVISGFYSNQNNESAAGVFYEAVDFTKLSLSVNKTQIFGEDFLAQFIGEPKTNDKTELLNYHINNVVLKNHGGAILLGEARYQTEYVFYDFFTKSYITRIIFHYDHILMISLDANGEIEWEKMIPKKQDSQEDGGYYLSLCPVVSSDKIYLLYNATNKNLNNVIVVEYNHHGESTQHIMTDLAEDVTIIPRAGKQVELNAAVIPAYKKSRFYLAKFILN